MLAQWLQWSVINPGTVPFEHRTLPNELVSNYCVLPVCAAGLVVPVAVAAVVFEMKT